MRREFSWAQVTSVRFAQSTSAKAALQIAFILGGLTEEFVSGTGYIMGFETAGNFMSEAIEVSRQKRNLFPY